MNSNYYKKTFYNASGQQKQLLNCIVGDHDLICCCEEPLQHITDLIFTANPDIKFKEETKQKIQKCLGTTQEEDGDDDAGIGEGELDRLFAEEFDENTG